MYGPLSENEANKFADLRTSVRPEEECAAYHIILFFRLSKFRRLDMTRIYAECSILYMVMLVSSP